MPRQKENGQLTELAKRRLERNQQIVHLYVDKMLTSTKIAALFGLSDTHVRRILNAMGITTDKKIAAWRELTCKICSRTFMKRRSEIIKMKGKIICDECKAHARKSFI